jgi:signal peptidase II
MHDTLLLQYAENHGAFLSAGQGMSDATRRLVLTGGGVLLVAATSLASLLLRELSVYSATALALIIAGGLGNLYDRLAHDGAVIDFMNIGIAGLHTGIFNCADVYLSVGVLMLLLADRINFPVRRKILR